MRVKVQPVGGALPTFVACEQHERAAEEVERGASLESNVGRAYTGHRLGLPRFDEQPVLTVAIRHDRARPVPVAEIERRVVDHRVQILLCSGTVNRPMWHHRADTEEYRPDSEVHMSRTYAAALLVGALVVLPGCGSSSSTPTGPSSMTGYQIVTGGTATLSAQSTGTVTASCPSGKVVTGGGYTTMDYSANIFDSAPTSNGSGWTVAAKNESLVVTNPSIVVTPFAVCVNRPGGYEIRSGQVSLRHQQVLSGEARCQDATFNLVGGGVASGDPQVHFFTSNPGSTSQPTWLSAFKSNYSIVLPSSSSGTTTAICASLLEVPGHVVATSAPTVLGNTSNATLTVSCPTGTMALSGGVSSGESPAIWFDSSPATDGSGWSASLRNPQTVFDPVTLHATLSATCASAS